MAKSAFDPETLQWKLAWPGRVARHDLVYSSPPADPTQGVPLGNGDIGVLVWCDSSQLIMVGLAKSAILPPIDPLTYISW